MTVTGASEGVEYPTEFLASTTAMMGVSGARSRGVLVPNGGRVEMNLDMLRVHFLVLNSVASFVESMSSHSVTNIVFDIVSPDAGTPP